MISKQAKHGPLLVRLDIGLNTVALLRRKSRRERSDTIILFALARSPRCCNIPRATPDPHAWSHSAARPRNAQSTQIRNAHNVVAVCTFPAQEMTPVHEPPWSNAPTLDLVQASFQQRAWRSSPVNALTRSSLKSARVWAVAQRHRRDGPTRQRSLAVRKKKD